MEIKTAIRMIIFNLYLALKLEGVEDWMSTCSCGDYSSKEPFDKFFNELSTLLGEEKFCLLLNAWKEKAEEEKAWLGFKFKDNKPVAMECCVTPRLIKVLLDFSEKQF